MTAPAPTPPTASPASGRLVSLDALRGFDMFWILGADALVQALGEVNGSPVARFFARQLDHRAWAGLTFYDLIFPLFVFISGTSLVYSLTRQIAEHGRGAAARRVLVRGTLLFVIGIFYILWGSSALATLQLAAPEHLRGRAAGHRS